MHRGRFGGNARKRKVKLTDATFHSMIGTTAPAESGTATILAVAPMVDVTLDDDVLESVAVALEVPLAMERRTGGRGFVCQDYQFGYVTCSNCRNDQVYYIRHTALLEGFTFRCRICQLEVTVSQGE